VLPDGPDPAVASFIGYASSFDGLLFGKRSLLGRSHGDQQSHHFGGSLLVGTISSDEMAPGFGA